MLSKRVHARSRRAFVVALGLTPVLVAAAQPLLDVARAARFLTRLDQEPTQELEHARLGPMDVQVVGPEGAMPLLLVHGVEPLGAAEPRLRALAEALAGEGFQVFTPDVRALRELDLGADLVEELGQVGDALAERGPFAIVGVSVGAGVILRAHAERGWRAPVLSIGGHADLADVAHAHELDEDGYAREVMSQLDLAPEALARLDPRPLDATARVFVLHGEGDPLVPPDHAARVCAIVACERVLVTPWLGHVERHGEGPWAVLRFTAAALDALHRG